MHPRRTHWLNFKIEPQQKIVQWESASSRFVIWISFAGCRVVAVTSCMLGWGKHFVDSPRWVGLKLGRFSAEEKLAWLKFGNWWLIPVGAASLVLGGISHMPQWLIEVTILLLLGWFIKYLLEPISVLGSKASRRSSCAGKRAGWMRYKPRRISWDPMDLPGQLSAEQRWMYPIASQNGPNQ